MKNLHVCAIVVLTVLGSSGTAHCQERSNAQLIDTLQFELQSTQPTGLLIPLYIYPANIHTNAEYNRLIELKRRYPEVPVRVILNPASGPGTGEIDANYTKAIDRLRGVGIVTLGYVSTEYGRVPLSKIDADVRQWRKRYPKVHGIFLDEQTNDKNEKRLQYYASATQSAHEAGYWPVVANPGTATISEYFDRQTADVIVVHENNFFPTEAELHGDFFGGYSDYPPWTRSVMIHSQAEIDVAQLRLLKKYVRWIYVTDDRYTPGDPQEPNPWDTLSKHMERQFQVLAESSAD